MAEFDFGEAAAIASSGKFKAFGIVVDDFVVFVDGLLILLLREGDFAEIELRVRSEVGVAVEVKIVVKFLAGEVVFAAGDVAETVRIE